MLEMFTIVLLCIFALKTSDAQFPNHMDLQKVGEAIFNNEKFNILKPTTHIISDYFKEFMLRRENTDFPTKRVFIDNNGLRHFWTGFGLANKSLRKTDDINANLITNTVNKESKDTTTFNIEDIKIFDAEIFAAPPKGRRNIKTQIKKLALRGGDDKVEETTKAAVKTTVKAVEAKTTEKADNGIMKLNGEAETTKKPAETTKITDGETTTAKAATTTKKSNPKAERVVAKTTFFCPYFGVITMAAFID